MKRLRSTLFLLLIGAGWALQSSCGGYSKMKDVQKCYDLYLICSSLPDFNERSTCERAAGFCMASQATYD